MGHAVYRPETLVSAVVGLRNLGAVSAFLSAAFVIGYSALGVAAQTGALSLFALSSWFVLGADLARVPVFMALRMPVWGRAVAWTWTGLTLALDVFSLLPIQVSFETFQLLAKAYWVLNALLAAWIVAATLREVGPIRPVGWLAVAMLLATPLWERVPGLWQWATWPLALVLWLVTAGVHLGRADSSDADVAAAADL